MRFEAGVSLTSNGAARISLFNTRSDTFHQWCSLSEAAAAIKDIVDWETVAVDTVGLGAALADSLVAVGVSVKRIGLIRSMGIDYRAVSEGELVAMAQEIVDMLSGRAIDDLAPKGGTPNHMPFDQIAGVVDELVHRHAARQFTEAGAMVQALRVRAAS